MKNVSLKLFLTNYIQLAMLTILLYVILGSSPNTSLPFILILNLPITAIILFTGLDEKLKKHLP